MLVVPLNTRPSFQNLFLVNTPWKNMHLVSIGLIILVRGNILDTH